MRSDRELREGMAAHLAAHPGSWLSAHELARVMGLPKGHNARVGAALAVLESEGVVVKTTEPVGPMGAGDRRVVTRWRAAGGL